MEHFYLVQCGRPDEIPEFWQFMGPMFASRAVAKELGNNLYDTDRTVWFISVEVGVLVGFGALTIAWNTATWHSNYIVPAHRMRGASTPIYDARARYLCEQTACTRGRATVRTAMDRRLHWFLRRGWTVARTNGQYSIIEKEFVHAS